MPFVVEKVTEMLFYLLQQEEGEEEKADDIDQDLPDPVNKIMRRSLRLDQNAVINLTAQLAQKLEQGGKAGGDAPADGGDKDKNPPRRKTQDELERNERLRRKVRTIAKMAKMFKTLREENEAVVRLKGVCPGHKLAPGLLLAGRDALTTELQKFDNASKLDKTNEMRPSAAAAAAAANSNNDGSKTGSSSPGKKKASKAK